GPVAVRRTVRHSRRQRAVSERPLAGPVGRIRTVRLDRLSRTAVRTRLAGSRKRGVPDARRAGATRRLGLGCRRRRDLLSALLARRGRDSTATVRRGRAAAGAAGRGPDRPLEGATLLAARGVCVVGQSAWLVRAWTVCYCRR